MGIGICFFLCEKTASRFFATTVFVFKAWILTLLLKYSIATFKPPNIKAPFSPSNPESNVLWCCLSFFQDKCAVTYNFFSFFSFSVSFLQVIWSLLFILSCCGACGTFWVKVVCSSLSSLLLSKISEYDVGPLCSC